MPWDNDHLAPVETLLFHSELVKVGSFECPAEDPNFSTTESLDNDVFVLPQNPLWIRRNAGEYRFVEPGAILMHRAGSMLERRCLGERGERTFWFGVHPEVFVDALQRYRLSTEQMGGALITDPQFRYRLALFLKQLERRPLDRLTIEEEVLTLLFEICDRRAAQERMSHTATLRTGFRQQRLVDKARAYLDAHLAESIGLETVAVEVGASLYHLCRVFRDQTGLTMHAYRTRQRIGRVVDRLVGGKSDNLSRSRAGSRFRQSQPSESRIPEAARHAAICIATKSRRLGIFKAQIHKRGI